MHGWGGGGGRRNSSDRMISEGLFGGVVLMDFMEIRIGTMNLQVPADLQFHHNLGFRVWGLGKQFPKP